MKIVVAKNIIKDTLKQVLEDFANAKEVLQLNCCNKSLCNN